MTYEEFLNSGMSDSNLKLINLTIIKEISQWLYNQFDVLLETSEQYPLNGFCPVEEKINKDDGLYTYVFEYGQLVYHLVSADNHFNFYTITINQDILNNSYFKNNNFNMMFDNNFKIKNISNLINETSLENGISINSSFETTNNDTKIFMTFTKGGDFLELNVNQNIIFFEYFHIILEKLYKNSIKNEIKETMFNKYPEIEDIVSFKLFLNLLNEEYQNDPEGLKMKIEVVSMIYI